LHWINTASRWQAKKGTIEPTTTDETGPYETALKYILSVEMRPLAVWGCNGMNDGRLSGLVEAVQVRHGRV
jgi:hypothetical protein